MILARDQEYWLRLRISDSRDLHVLRGDFTEYAADAIVNAANSDLLPGGVCVVRSTIRAEPRSHASAPGFGGLTGRSRRGRRSLRPLEACGQDMSFTPLARYGKEGNKANPASSPVHLVDRYKWPTICDCRALQFRLSRLAFTDIPPKRRRFRSGPSWK